MIKNLEQLKAVINIREVISSYIPLKKISGSFKALCPFHSEKTPSLVISEEKGLFHCFGCKEGGDAFKFVEKFKHYDFNEAVREIADFYNFELEFDGVKATPKKDYFAFYERLNTFFKANLRKNEKVMAWLINRGLKDSDLVKFDVGLVPPLPQLQSLVGDDEKMALELGFFIRHSKSGAIYSQFENRLSFALRNSIFKIVGFSCRTHPYFNFNKSAKYINSRESFLFQKSKFLYNLPFAKSAYFKKDENGKMDEKRRLIIVEGFFDSIALNSLGYAFNVASCGTAFNSTHLAQLLRGDIDKFALCFDKDEAGKKANLKACELLFKYGFFESEVWTILGDYKDIGEVLESGENLRFEKKNAFEYYIRENLKLIDNARGKDKFLKMLLKSINRQNNYYLKEFCLGILEKITGFTFKTQQKVSLKRTNFDSEKALFKTILSDKKASIIAKELLFAEYFETYEKSLLLFNEKGERDEVAKALLLDNSVEVLKESDFELLCVNFKKAFLNKMLDKAKIDKNYAQIIKIQQEMQDLLKVPEIF